MRNYSQKNIFVRYNLNVSHAIKCYLTIENRKCGTNNEKMNILESSFEWSNQPPALELLMSVLRNRFVSHINLIYDC
jgi:hypothetical protein